MRQRERCGSCHHGAHPSGPCNTVEVSGPPHDHIHGEHPDQHPGRDVTPCDCEEHVPDVNGVELP